MSIGASVLIGYLVKPLGDYLDFPTTYTLNIILILIAIVPILLIKSVVDRNKKIKLQLYLKMIHLGHTCYRTIGKLLKYTFELYCYYYIRCYDLWVYISKESNFIYLVAISLLLAIILFQNVLLYAQTEITGKIGKIKSNS